MFSPIPDIIEELRSGRMVVLADDESRENEGDLIIAAEKVTPETINFMATQGRGLICLALTSGRCDELGLDLMASDKDSKFGTAFTVSIDAATGVTNGVSVHDRAKTILTAIDDFCRPSDLVIPGHIFPLRAREGGTLVRAGHTEGSVDLACLAELKPAAVVCEIMKEDGTMARIPDLVKFCKKHQLKLASIADIIEYRRRSEKLIEKIADADLSTAFGRFHLHYYKSLIDENVHLALTSGQVGREEETPVLVRVHSRCFTGDVFHSLHCDCRLRLDKSLIRIAREGKGVLLYIRQTEQHARLAHEVNPHTLQEKRQNTIYARAQLAQHSDLREYGIGAQILLDLGIRKMCLLTNNTKKIHALTGYGLEVVDQLPIESATRPDSQLAPEQI